MSTMELNKVYRSGEIAKIDLGTLGARVVFNVQGISEFSFTVSSPAATWLATAVLTVKYSIDGTNFYTVGTSVAVGAAGMTALLNCKAVKFVALETTTAGATPNTLWDVAGYGE